MKPKIVCIGNGPVMSFTPYMSKLAGVLASKEIDVDFLTWTRIDDATTAIDPGNVTIKVLLHAGCKGDSRFKLVFIYLFWMFKLFFSVLFHNDKYYICSRFENCFPVYLASFFRRIDYIYADRDALFSTYNWPFGIKRFIKVVETKIAGRAAVHLIPGESRRFTDFSNVEIIPNLPTTQTIVSAKELFEARSESFKTIYSDTLIVYVNGWLSPSRGKAHIIEAIKSSKLEGKVHFIIAGDLDNDIKSLVSSSVNCTYLGRLSNAEALSYYFDCHLVVSLYDPSIEINRYAEPNKWWDCVVTNTPFITNYGIETLSAFEKLIGFFQINYNEVSSLTCFLDEFNKATVNSMTDGITTNLEYYSWDKKMSHIINNFLECRNSNV